MKKVLSIMAVIAISSFLFGTVNAQTVKYKRVKSVDRNTGVEHATMDDVRFITFSNNYSSFQFTSPNGQPINGNQQGYWSFCNRYVKPAPSQTYIPSSDEIMNNLNNPKFINPRIFRYQGVKNGAKVYLCRRSVCDHNNRVVGYINDYIYFSEDMSRFNIYSGGDERSNGIYGSGSSDQLTDGNTILVYEKAESNSNPILY